MPWLRPPSPRLGRLCVVLIASVVIMGCATPKQQWPAPSDPMQRTAAAHLVPTKQEEFTTHTHAHLDVFLNGDHVPVPAGIGIDIHANGVDENPSPLPPGKQYRVGVCDVPCLSPLHTHDPSGTLHTESVDPPPVVFTLGQFFAEWGVKLDSSCIGEFCAPSTEITFYVDGVKQTGDPAAIPLAANTEIAIVIGSPPSAIPSTWEFQPGE